MHSLGQALKKIISDLGIEKQVLHYQAINYWPIAVGERIAKISRAEKVDNNILFVKVLNDSWRNELLFLKKEIIEKLNKKIGTRVIEDIRLY